MKKLALFLILALPLCATNRYVYSAAAGTADGTSWTNAYTTLGAAISAAAAGDTIWLADMHSESSGFSITYTSPGTNALPLNIICTNTHVTVPPTAKGTGCAIATTGTASITTGGTAYVYGVSFTAGSTASTVSIQLRGSWVCDHCTLALGTTSTAGRISLGTSSGDERIELIDSTFTFGNVSQGITLVNGYTLIRGASTSIAATGSVPTTLFVTTSNGTGTVEVQDVDLSNFGSGNNLVNVTGTATIQRWYFRNCKLGASVAKTTGTISAIGMELYFDNVDSGNTNYQSYTYKFQGSTAVETTHVLTGGASDGTTPISWNMTTLSAGPSLFSPLQSNPIYVWNETTGSSVTVTAQILHDSASNLTNADAWLRCEALTTSGYPLGAYYSGRVADTFASATNLTAGIGSGSWNTTGMTNPNSQQVSVSFTPQSKGPIACRAMLAKTNYTIYVDPKLSVQ